MQTSTQAISFSRCGCIRVGRAISKQSDESHSSTPLERREAERREARSSRKPHQRMRPPPPNAPHFRYGPYGGGSPLGAPPRRLPRKSMPRLSPGRVSWDLRQQVLPTVALSQSSGAPRRPVIMPAEAMPRPPGSKVTSPARGNRTRPVSRIVSRNVPHWAGNLYVTVLVTNVNG